jgi:hypothetical protein
MIGRCIRFIIQVCENLLNYLRVFYAGYDFDLASTRAAGGNINFKDSLESFCPCE